MGSPNMLVPGTQIKGKNRLGRSTSNSEQAHPSQNTARSHRNQWFCVWLRTVQALANQCRWWDWTQSWSNRTV